MAKITNLNTQPKAIIGSNCIIGRYYRRVSEPEKVYICARDTSRDTIQRGTVLHYGCTLVSLDHGNRITSNLHLEDFIEVDVEVTYKDTRP